MSFQFFSDGFKLCRATSTGIDLDNLASRHGISVRRLSTPKRSLVNFKAAPSTRVALLSPFCKSKRFPLGFGVGSSRSLIISPRRMELQQQQIRMKIGHWNKKTHEIDPTPKNTVQDRTGMNSNSFFHVPLRKVQSPMAMAHMAKEGSCAGGFGRFCCRWYASLNMDL